MSATRILAIFRKELKQLTRDRLTFGMIIGIPMLQMILFGYAINTDVRHLHAAVADQAQTQLSRAMIQDAQASQVLDIVAERATAEELEQLMRDGIVSIGIFIPHDFERRLQQGDRVAAQLLVDGSDPVILGAAQQLARMPVRLDTATGPVATKATFEVRAFYNPERRSAVNIVPGLIGVILTMTMVLFTAVAIVRERERGNLEMLITTPVSTPELMIGKVLPYILIGLIQVTIILGLGALLFQVPVNGSLVDIYLASLLFIGANLTLGLVISAVAKNQFQAMQMTFFFFLPSILLSGFMFPFEGMPLVARYIAEILPLTHFLRLIRGIMLRGAEIAALAPEVLALLAFMVLTMLIAILKFRKSLD
ncbi:MAG: ABC transporter permease [Gammaproteobacteria bacterium]|nr:ABC transporter permease [Gammaproteobacteria bacterium]